MGTFNVNGAHHGTLAAGVIDTVTFPSTGAAHEFLITNTAASDIYVRFDGGTVAIGGDDSYIVPGNGQLDFYQTQQPIEITVVKLIGNNNGSYHCQRI